MPMQLLTLVLNGLRQALRSANRKWLLFSLTLLTFVILFSIPIFTIEGNSLSIQLSMTRLQDAALLLLLSLLLSLVCVLQLERKHCGRACRARAVTTVGIGGAGILGTAFAGLLATAACSSCLVGVLGIVGIGSTVAFTLLDYRWYVVWVVILLAGLAIILTARTIGRLPFRHLP